MYIQNVLQKVSSCSKNTSGILNHCPPLWTRNGWCEKKRPRNREPGLSIEACGGGTYSLIHAHLKRSERTPHFGTAVSLGYLQMAAPPLENLQFALECLQAPSVPGREGPSVLTLATGENISWLESGFNRSLWIGCSARRHHNEGCFSPFQGWTCRKYE